MSKGWKNKRPDDSQRHGLASRGYKSTYGKKYKYSLPSSPMAGSSASRHGKAIENWIKEEMERQKNDFKGYQETEAEKDAIDTSFMYIIERGVSPDGVHYIELRTDALAYDVVYDGSEYYSVKKNREFYEGFEKEFPSLYFEHMGGGVMRVYYD
jgi:hypothetical protein